MTDEQFDKIVRLLKEILQELKWLNSDTEDLNENIAAIRRNQS